MLKQHFPLAVGLCLAASAFGGFSEKAAATTNISIRVACEIRATRSESGTRLDAIIRGTGPVSGTYAFKVNQRGGDELISETGDFKIEVTTPTEINKAGIDLPLGNGYSAVLTIQWANGTSSCSAAVS